MWYEEAVFYQVFPLGFCDGLRDNDGVMNRCISEFADWIPHLQKLGTDAVYFSPIFESDYHGYDTRDYRVIDKRIGTNKNFAELVSKLHEAGIKVVIDGIILMWLIILLSRCVAGLMNLILMESDLMLRTALTGIS